MAATPPPGYTPPPVDLPQRGDRATFSNRVDAWVTWFSTVILTQLAALVANAYANALDAFASATSALGASTAAQTAQTAAQAARDTALTYSTAAQAAQSAAAASAAAAANSVTGLTANSSSAVVLGNGSKTFTVPAGKQFAAGVFLQFVSTGTPTARMFGTVASYSGTTLTATTTQSEGPGGTYSDWVIAPGGGTGAAGGITGGNLTGAINELKAAAAPASSATPDVWGAGGNRVPITQTAAITGFPNAPQAGAERTLQIVNGCPLTAGANLVVHGGSITLAPGDEVDIVADTVSMFIATVRKNDGTATIPSVDPFQSARLYRTSGIFVAPKTGWYRVTGAGSAGQGARIVTGSSFTPSSNRLGATGGSAPGLFKKSIFMQAGQSCVCSVATGVAAMVFTGVTSAGAAANGGNGGTTTFSGSGLPTLTANGGMGGSYSAANVAITGSVGGTATGGDQNIQGGGSGGISSGFATGLCLTGGGALGIQGVGYASGTAAQTASATYALSGGAGIGGKSGNALGNGASGGTVVASSGGGSGAASSDLTSASNGSAGMEATSTGYNIEGGLGLALFASALFSATGSGSTGAPGGGVAIGAVYSGGGSGGNLNTSQQAQQSGGVFAGSGGAYIQSGGTAPAGNGGLFGGGSGGMLLSAATGTVNAGGATDNGWLLVEWN